MFLNFNRLASFIDSVGIGGPQIFRNRLRLREGPGAIDAEHIGGLTSGIHSSLLTNASLSPSEDPVIQVFASWPKDWDAEFTLLARGGFLVSSSQRKGEVQFAELLSQLGQECHLKNPWNGAEVMIFRDGKKGENLSGPLLKFATQKGEKIVVVRAGMDPAQFNRTVLD
jgi:hypothetical protein